MRAYALAVALGTASLLVGCGGSSHHYSASVIQNFMDSCEQTSGGAQGACQCILDKLEARYDETEFSRLEVRLQARGLDALPDDVLDDIADCR